MNKEFYRSVRKELNLTQVEMAQLIGVTENSIQNYEAGKREPKGTIMFRYFLYSTQTPEMIELEAEEMKRFDEFMAR